MTTTRQDAWSKDEDILLAEVVLRLIREGGTQLQAFEEVGKLLSRTSAACGFRWNSYVRKQYKSGIELAKKQRKLHKKATVLLDEEEKQLSQEEPQEQKETLPLKEFDEVLLYLKEMYNSALKWETAAADTDAHQEKQQALEEKITKLTVENEKLQRELNSIEEAYKALVELMEQARNMVVLKEEDKQQKV
ncbi:RsfA family transcriptional regulator [Niallia nealsonii]|uniref:RsfA family transcriptional regulator n=1 Tax=Niallia nealsonii TaxID=115979 RepID=A0A2N0YY04_9BACI|nr:RsfA family transcriptional regulator [Niallia nealsonii]PKG22141.1 RsfA family transcriptional regulator [Niallia nealsonii]